MTHGFARRRWRPRFLDRAELSIAGLLRVTLVAASGGVFLILATVFALYVVNRSNVSWVQHSREVARQARKMQAQVQQERNSRFVYAATADPEARARIDSLRDSTQASVELLAALTVDNPDQQWRIRELRRALQGWHATPPALPVTGSAEPAIGAFDRVRLMMSAFVDAEDTLYMARARRAERAQLFGSVAIGIELLAVIAALLLIRRRAIRQATELEEQSEQLQDQAVELENQLAEIEASTEELQETVIELEEQRAQARAGSHKAQELLAVLDSLLSSAPVGIAFYDRELRCIRANAAIAAVHDRTVADQIGRKAREFMAADVVDRLVSLYTEVLKTGETRRGEVTRRAGTEREQRFDATFFPVHRSGDIVGVGAVAMDVTERAHLEAQFRQAQKMEAVGRLAGGIAHDFNNLLTVIRSYVDILDLELDGPEALREYTNEIRSAADRAAGLTRQLLAFSRKQLLLPRLLDVNEVIGGTEQMLRRLLAANIDLQLTLRPGLGAVCVDPGQLEQIVMNLAINAGDAMLGGGRLAIETAGVTLDEEYANQHAGVVAGRYVAIIVSDTGTGMDAATRARVFEPFFTTKAVGVGTGLGLSTVYGIVKQSHGHVAVYSEPGEGATFTVYLPVVAGSADMPEAETASATSPRGTETILLVEDETGVREVLRRFLERQGYRVLAAQHGGEALRLAAAHDGPIDLVISDLMMPELGGRKFVERLRDRHGDIPVVFMSGYTDDEVMRRGLRDRQHAFIQKPFALDEVGRKVRAVLDG